jgi:hypothetical protein
LRFLIAGEGLQRLEFDDDVLVAYEVRPVFAGQPSALIVYWQLLSSLKRDVPIRQFHRQCLLINRFQKSRAKLPVYFHRRPDDGACLRVP